jgi:hypothetical protein
MGTGEKGQIRINFRGDGVIVAGSKMGIINEPCPFPAEHQRHLINWAFHH